MRNRLKIRVLEALNERAWLNASMISALTGLRPVRAVYTYMIRLKRWGLVRRRKPLGGNLLYSISERGRARLIWLREHSR